jgi:hypothetical protein
MNRPHIGAFFFGVFMAGTIPLSMTQQLDEFGAPLAGGHLYLIQAGTVSTPQNGYQDSALTLPWPNPIILDASGRLPQFFLADGSIKIRLTDVNGVEKLVADGLIVTGASSGGGGGSPVDATTVLATGDLKPRYGTGTLTGFVRGNGRTIGSATSGSSERANADTQALFEYLWNADANLVVSTGRGATSIADWSANKTIALPDFRGRALAFMDDMGSSAAGRLTATYFGTAATVLGAAGGSESKVVVTANLPPYTPAGSVSNTSPLFTDAFNTAGGATTMFRPGSTTPVGIPGAFTGTPQGGVSTPVAIASPMMLATIYVKL